MVEVIVAKLGHDGQQKMFVIILQERGGERLLPIWIGRPEAEAIAAQLHGVPRERPMTHDLTRALVLALEGDLVQVVVTRVEEHTYFAEMHLARGNDRYVVDARPSDAIALALRFGAPVFATEDLLGDFEELVAEDTEPGEPAPPDEPIGPDAPSEAELLRRHLQQMNPEDFGKFSG